MNLYNIVLSWPISNGRTHRDSYRVPGNDPDTAIQAARYLWLAAATIRGLRDVEACFGQYVRLELVTEIPSIGEGEVNIF